MKPLPASNRGTMSVSSNSAGAASGDWKKRCLQLEQQQETLQQDGELLCKVLQRFCAVAEGVDEELDHQIGPLQEALKNFPPPSSFARQARTLESGILRVLQRRDDGTRFSLESLSQLVRQLESSQEDSGISSKLKELNAELPESVEKYFEYPRLLNELARVQARVLDMIHNPDDKAELAINGNGEGDRKVLCQHIGGLLLKMLDQLSMPEEMIPRARKLMTQIEAGFEWDELEPVLHDAVELVVRATVTGHKDFEDYLQGLNIQLDDIQSFLTESRDEHSQARESSRRLDESLRSNVAKVEVSLAESSSLDQLKNSVRSQLGNIVSAVDSYREEQTQRQEKAEQRLHQLQQQIEEMEQKAADFQSHLEEQRLRAMSDPLTGLPNRAAFDECIVEQRGQAAADGRPLTLVICDLDHFKRVNDNYGHLAGDKVLRLVAKILRGGLRESDFIGRYGGEEFVMVLPHTSAVQAMEVMEKLRRVMEQSPFNFKGQPVQVTMSFGIAENQPGEEPEGLFSRADNALYRAKEMGRNRSVVAD